jgi:hypothetical protein
MHLVQIGDSANEQQLHIDGRVVIHYPVGQSAAKGSPLVT